MTNNPAGLFVVFAYVAAVLLSLPITVSAWGLWRFGLDFRTALLRVGLVLLTLLTLGVLSLVVLVDAEAALFAAGVAAGTLLAMGVLPLVVGRRLVERFGGLPPDDALRYATAGWPLALAGSVLLFVAPGGLGRYNVTFLEGPAGVAAFLLVAAVVVLGPTAAGLGLYRGVRRFA